MCPVQEDYRKFVVETYQGRKRDHTVLHGIRANKHCFDHKVVSCLFTDAELILHSHPLLCGVEL